MHEIKMHDVQRARGGNRYCGPAVLSSLLGIDTDAGAQLIRETCPDQHPRSVRGTSPRTLRRTLYAQGLDTEAIPWAVDADGGVCRRRSDTNILDLFGGEAQLIPARRPTLATWLRLMREWRTPGRVFLIASTRHWLLVSGRRYVCGLTGTVVSVRSKSVKRRVRVTGAWEVIPRDRPRECTPRRQDDPHFRGWEGLQVTRLDCTNKNTATA